MGVVNFSFVPLETVSSRAAEIYQKAKEYIESLHSDTTLPGLLHQYKIQLERLEPGKNQPGLGCEITGAPSNSSHGASSKATCTQTGRALNLRGSTGSQLSLRRTKLILASIMVLTIHFHVDIS
jgi:hypothetical protein